jgi:hypothetical protein
MKPFLFFLTILLLTHTQVAAQDSSSNTVWYWAIREGTNELLAYDADGTVNVLAKEFHKSNIKQVWRIDPQTALVVTITPDSPGYSLSLSIMTSNTIEPLSLGGETRLFSFQSAQVEDEIGSYAHFDWASRIQYELNVPNQDTNTYLIYLNSRTIEEVTPLSPNIQVSALSSDSKILNYVVQDSAAKTLIFRKKVLSTGEEATVYTLKGLDFIVQYDHVRERWLVSAFDWSSAIFIYDDGHTESTTIYINDVLPLCHKARSEDYIETVITGKCYDLFSQKDGIEAAIYACSENCFSVLFPNTNLVDVLTTPYDEMNPIKFTLPSPSDTGTIGRIDETRRIIDPNLGDYWIVDSEGEPRFLGKAIPLPSDIGDDGDISLNNQWLIAELKTDKPPRQYGIWDLIHEKIVFENELPSDGVFVHQFKDGMIFEELVDNKPAHTRLFRFDDQAIFDIPMGVYFDILADHSLLFERDDNWYGYNDDAIYRYDPEKQISVALLKDVDNLYLQELHRDH